MVCFGIFMVRSIGAVARNSCEIDNLNICICLHVAEPRHSYQDETKPAVAPD